MIDVVVTCFSIWLGILESLILLGITVMFYVIEVELLSDFIVWVRREKYEL